MRNVNTQTLPDWYTAAPDDIPRHPAANRRADKPVRRALSSLAETLARELTIPPCLGSWLGGIEVRYKIIGVFLMVIAVTALHSLWSLAAVLAVALAVQLSIRLPIRMAARVWLGAPLFSLAIILPAATNLVTPGASVFDIWRLGHILKIGPWVLPSAISVTDAGLVVSARFMLRALDCVSLTYLLIATTDPTLLLNGLRNLGVPRVFGMVLTMAQRYIAVMLRAAEEIHLAKLSRTISGGPMRSEQRWAAAGIGILFRRTYRLAGEVQNAMVSRGYDGDLQIGSHSIARASDMVWLIAVIVLSTALIVIERVLC